MCSKKKSLNCEVKLTLNTKDNMVVSIRGKHSHDNNLLKDEVTKKVKNQLRDITNQPYTAPRSVIQSLATKVLEDPKTQLAWDLFLNRTQFLKVCHVKGRQSWTVHSFLVRFLTSQFLSQ